MVLSGHSYGEVRNKRPELILAFRLIAVEVPHQSPL